MTRMADLAALVLLLAFTAAMAVNPVDIQAHNRIAASVYAGTFSGNTARLVLGAYLLVRGPAAVFRLLSRSWLVWLVLLPLLASGLWSVDPARTAATTLDLALVIFCAATLAERLGAAGLIRALLLAGAAIVLVSCLGALSGSGFALMGAEHEGLWRGFFTHKNSFGAFAAMVLVLAVTLPTANNSWVRLGAVALCLLALWRAGSIAADIAAAVALIAAATHWAMGRVQRLAAVLGTLMLTALTALALALPTYLESLAVMLGRDGALSGRAGLWSAAWSLLQTRPFGAGYGTGGGALALEWMQQATGWAGARQPHNAYLALALDMGWIGLLAYVALLALTALLLAARPARPLDRAILALLALHATLGMAEASAGLYPTVTVFVLCCLFAASAETVPATKRSAMAEMV
jgi:O-antigen ligase